MEIKKQEKVGMAISAAEQAAPICKIVKVG